jgi:hypothetical protein
MMETPVGNQIGLRRIPHGHALLNEHRTKLALGQFQQNGQRISFESSAAGRCFRAHEQIDCSEGPPFINYAVTQTSRLSLTRLLVAHLKN